MSQPSIEIIPELNLRKPERDNSIVFTWSPSTEQPDEAQRQSQVDGVGEPTGQHIMTSEEESILRAQQATTALEGSNVQLNGFLSGQITRLLEQRSLGTAKDEILAKQTQTKTEALIAATGRVATQKLKVDAATEAASQAEAKYTTTRSVPVELVEQVRADISVVIQNLQSAGAEKTTETMDSFERAFKTFMALRGGTFTRSDGTPYPFLEMVTATGLAFDENTVYQNALRFQRTTLAAEEAVVVIKQEELDSHTAVVEERSVELLRDLVAEQYYDQVRGDRGKGLFTYFRTAYVSWRRERNLKPQDVEACHIELADRQMNVIEGNIKDRS